MWIGPKVRTASAAIRSTLASSATSVWMKWARPPRSMISPGGVGPEARIALGDDDRRPLLGEELAGRPADPAPSPVTTATLPAKPIHDRPPCS